MEAALSDHKRELAAKAHEAAELRARCEALAGENVELAGAVSELEAKVRGQHWHEALGGMRNSGLAIPYD
jgi:hypothetical protein